jgi:amylosucrase
VEAALYEQNEEALARAIDADVMLHACMLTLRGIPVLYSGDELGMLNDYGYHDDPGRQADSRNIHRGKMDWKKAEERFDATKPTWRIFNEIKKLIMIRKYNDVFHSDAHVYPVDTGDNRVLGIIREYHGKRMQGLFNFSPDHVWAEADGSGYQLQPYGFRWLMNIYID